MSSVETQRFSEDFVSYANAAVSQLTHLLVTLQSQTMQLYRNLRRLWGIATFATALPSLPIQVLREPPTQRAPTHLYRSLLIRTTCGPLTMPGYAHTAGIATVASNLTGTPSIVIDNINSAIGIVTMPGQGSKMRFDFDSTLDMPAAASWRGMFAFANNSQQAYVSYGTTIGGYQGWRRILVEDQYGNDQTSGI